MDRRMGLHCAVQKDLPKKRGVYEIKPRVGTEHPGQSGRAMRLSMDRDDSQHPFGDQATAFCLPVSEKLADECGPLVLRPSLTTGLPFRG